MAQNGWRGDAEQREEVESVNVSTHSLEAREAGQFAIDDLMRAQSAERPRSLLARLFGANPVGADSEQLFARALGERAVGKLLAQLGRGWSALHSVPVGPEVDRLDHLVIGPAGVFTVTTRNHPGQDVAVSGRTVLVAGMKVAHIRDAEHDLGRAERNLSGALGESLAVTGLLVFVNPVSLTMRNVPKDLQVLHSSELLPWLEAQPDVLDDTEVERIVTAARLSTTWDAPLDVESSSDPDELKNLLRLVERSRTIRQLWFGVVVIVVVVAATALATVMIVNMSPGGVAH